jgi:metal-dependent HD superfamily phosphatase/phosphodiesterase
VYPNADQKRVIIRSLALEGIIGHMASRRIHSIEAGIILIADGCDMEKGRARIPMVLNTEPKAGDIHKYSANSIERVRITRGDPKPVRIEVGMSSDVGFFQIEEVLLPKVNMSPAKQHIELYAGIVDQELKKYL